MLKNKGLVSGLAALVVLVGLFFMMSGGKAPEAPVETTMTSGTETGTGMMAEDATPPADPNQPPMPEMMTDMATPPAAAEGEIAPAPAEAIPATPPPEGVPADSGAVTPAAEPAADTTQSLLAAPTSMQSGLNIDQIMQDRVAGDESAPVTIVEYASFTCPHCAHFSNNLLPQIKEKLIKTGKAKMIFREFPLDQLAMKAAKIARCAPAEKYFDFIEVLFSNQERWVKAEDPEKSLMQLGTLVGMSDEQMRSCLDNTDIETRILSGMQDAQTKFAIKSTPTFVFNFGAETLSGANDVAKFEEIVNKLSAGQ